MRLSDLVENASRDEIPSDEMNNILDITVCFRTIRLHNAFYLGSDQRQ